MAFGSPAPNPRKKQKDRQEEEKEKKPPFSLRMHKQYRFPTSFPPGQ